jgi:hypothetical protein
VTQRRWASVRSAGSGEPWLTKRLRTRSRACSRQRQSPQVVRLPNHAAWQRGQRSPPKAGPKARTRRETIARSASCDAAAPLPPEGHSGGTARPRSSDRAPPAGRQPKHLGSPGWQNEPRQPPRPPGHSASLSTQAGGANTCLASLLGQVPDHQEAFQVTLARAACPLRLGWKKSRVLTWLALNG